MFYAPAGVWLVKLNKTECIQLWGEWDKPLAG